MILFIQPGADPLLWTWDPGLGIRARGVTCQASSKSALNLPVWAGPGLFVEALVGECESCASSTWPGNISSRALGVSGPLDEGPLGPSTSASPMKVHISFNFVFHLNITTQILILDINLPSG